MTYLLPFVLLALLHEQIQPVQASFSIALPLAVRSPYLSCWLPQGNASANATDQYRLSPTRFNLSQTRDLDILVRVDNVGYSILGSPLFPNQLWMSNLTSYIPGLNFANITNTMVTPTQIILSAAAGPMQVNLTILNPIEPGDWVKQSIPFSYISLTAMSLDNLAHKIEVYSDISQTWITTDNTQLMRPNMTSNTDVTYYAVTFWEPVLFSEFATEAGWGTLYYAMKTESNVTYTLDGRFNAIADFTSIGILDNQGIITTSLDNISDTVFAISRDLGTIQATQAPVVWAIGYTTDPAISYANQSDTPQQRSPYYKLRYVDDELLITDFLNDFVKASQRAQQLDQKILQDAASVSDLLGDLVSLAVPQVYGSSQLTIGTDANGNLNESDVMMFMKNIGGDIPNRVNPVEILYAAFPALMYIDPTLGAPLLEPLFRFQALPDYDVQYAAKDLGSSYPNVTASKSIHNEGVEQTGNMLIMTYAHARASGDGSLISRYYPVLTSWANYLSNSSIFNVGQSNADGEGVVYYNQTNLAIKGIIAIRAMSKMSSFAGEEADADRYSNITAYLYAEWKTAGLGSDQHILTFYGVTYSWTLGYNLFADKWLGTGVVDESVYDGHSNYINNIPSDTLAGANQTAFDLPTQSMCVPNCFTTVSSWNLFVAAMTSNSDLCLNRIRRVHDRASLFGNQSMGIFPLSYDSTDGSDISGMANPAQGAMFAPLAMKIPIQNIHFNTTTASPPKTSPRLSNTSSKSSRVATVAGATVGGIAALLLVVGMVSFVLWRQRRYDIRDRSAPLSGTMQSASEIGITPFILPRLNAIHGDPVHRMGRQQQQSGPPEAAAMNADAGDPVSLSLPSGLYSQSFPFVPVGLSAKELARMRAETLRPQPAITPPVSDESHSQPPPSPVATTPTSSPVIRTVQSQFDRIWREIQQLRAERFGSEAPPSYAEGDVR